MNPIPSELQPGDEVAVETDHGIVMKIRGREVWYRSLDDGQVRRTVLGQCTWLPPSEHREATQEAIRDSWGDREQQSRVVQPNPQVDIGQALALGAVSEEGEYSGS
ncbi:hypothetical protein [Aeoliella sp.]|uniref:hypothetical protein n=1 Tax=Aeoliella sp. TaxID=2795800 RepID=UPI003CCBC560